MEIITAMILTILKVIYYVFEAAMIVGIIGAILVTIGMGGIYYKRWDDRRTEKDDHDGDYFEESRVAGAANKRLLSADESDMYWREIDRLNDDLILKNTKDL